MTSPLSALQRQASSALGEIRNAVGDLASTLRPDRVIDEDLLLPVRRLVQGLAGVAELAVGPMVQMVEIQRKFVEAQRNLADQMASWAELQHQLADRMMAWAEMQRQVAGAIEASLAPVSGAAQLTSRLLRDAAGGVEERPATGPDEKLADVEPADDTDKSPPKRRTTERRTGERRSKAKAPPRPTTRSSPRRRANG